MRLVPIEEASLININMAIEFSKKTRDIIAYSIEEARRLRSPYYGEEHFVLAMLRDKENEAFKALMYCFIETYRLRRLIEDELSKVALPEGEENDKELFLSSEGNLSLKTCIVEAQSLSADAIGPEHILLAIVHNQQSFIASFLMECGATYNTLRTAIEATMGNNNEEEEEDDEGDFPKWKKGSATEEQWEEKKSKSKGETTATPLLDRFGTDLIAAAHKKQLDPVIGRNKEIERIAQILGRRKKNNPVLIGLPGVGKSAVVEGLALRISRLEVPATLINKRLIALNMTNLVAGTKYRGQFEERMRDIIDEVKESGNVILFIDEIHTIVGAGAVSQHMDAANILKPALARGEIQCIGATTLDEYRESIEKDGALERRFQKVMLDPPTIEEAIEILEQSKIYYENYHKVIYTPEAIEACVRLTDRYVTDRYLPDKAFDALDEAGARMHLEEVSQADALETKKILLQDIEKQKQQAMEAEDYERLNVLKVEKKQIQMELTALSQDWYEQKEKNFGVITSEHIAIVVASMTGVPVQRIQSEESEKLKNLRPQLLSKVIGQEEAVDTVVRAIQRSRIGLKDPKKPIGTFLFLGPTGVGKTYLAQELAVELFGSRDALIRIDMSEYMEKFNVTRLVGSPPGYVGYDEGGQLTEAVRRKPYSIVLLDEIEKAHPDVFNLLLQVLDEGRLTDSNGRYIDFRNTVIILTSNVGSRQLKDFGVGIGFSTQNRVGDKHYAHSVIEKSLHKTFSPEFINRLDRIITFDSLNEEALKRIIDIELKKLHERITAIGYNIEITPEALQFIAKKGYDVQYGARPLKRALQTYVEDTLSTYIIEESPEKGSILQLSLGEDNESIIAGVKCSEEL